MFLAGIFIIRPVKMPRTQDLSRVRVALDGTHRASIPALRTRQSTDEHLLADITSPPFWSPFAVAHGALIRTE